MIEAEVTSAQLLALPDNALPREAATALLAEIDCWCDRTGTGSSEFGQLALDFGGFVGLLRKRSSARTRMAAIARAFMIRWPDGVPDDLKAAERKRAFNLLAPLRSPGLRRTGPPLATPDEPPPPAYPDGREPCFWCGVRGDLGCSHRTVAVSAQQDAAA